MFSYQCKSVKIWVFIVILGFATNLQAEIVETRDLRNVLPHIDDKTWVLVDLDNCMFEGAEALGHANWFYDVMQKHMQNGLTRDEAIKEAYPEWIKVQKLSTVKALDLNFVPVLKTLQDRGVVIMGLTHRQPSVAESTIRHVHSLDFDFTLTAPSEKSLTIPAKTPTLYIQGILFVGDYNKKIDIFGPFLKMLGQKPQKIVFIDDKRKNVEELEALSKDGIDYVGVHFTAIEHATPVYVPEIAEMQSKFLDTMIISNEAALLLMENSHE